MRCEKEPLPSQTSIIRSQGGSPIHPVTICVMENRILFVEFLSHFVPYFDCVRLITEVVIGNLIL